MCKLSECQVPNIGILAKTGGPWNAGLAGLQSSSDFSLTHDFVCLELVQAHPNAYKYPRISLPFHFFFLFLFHPSARDLRMAVKIRLSLCFC